VAIVVIYPGYFKISLPAWADLCAANKIYYD